MRRRANIISIFLMIYMLAIFLSGCYEHEEGCRDVRAENYSVNADKDCDDCCNYPPLLLHVIHQYEEEPVDTNRFIEHLGDTFRIRALNFFLSDFRLINTEGNDPDTASILETIPVQFDKSVDTTFHDVVFPTAKVNLARTNVYQLGTFRKVGVYNAVRMDFGIRDSINHASMERIPASNSLYQNQDSMYINQMDGFYFLKMQLEFSDETEKSINISGDINLQSLHFNQTFDFSQRADREIFLTILYDNWFETINFRAENNQSIGEKLLDKLDEALILE